MRDILTALVGGLLKEKSHSVTLTKAEDGKRYLEPHCNRCTDDCGGFCSGEESLGSAASTIRKRGDSQPRSRESMSGGGKLLRGNSGVREDPI